MAEHRNFRGPEPAPPPAMLVRAPLLAALIAAFAPSSTPARPSALPSASPSLSIHGTHGRGTAEAREDEGATELERALAVVHELMERRQWSAAEERLVALVREHAEADALQPLVATIRDDLRRCAFWSARGEPDWDALVAGRVRFYSPRTGQLEVAYGPEELADFGPFGAGDVASRYLHPVAFDGAYSVELRGKSHPPRPADGPTPTVWVGLEPSLGTGWAVVFGLAGATPEEPSLPAAIYRVEDGATELVASRADSPVRAGRPFRLRVEVSPSRITALVDGRKLLEARKGRNTWGQIAVEGVDGFGELVLRGRASASWLRGLADAALQREREAFERGWEPPIALPERRFGAVEPPSTAPASVTGLLESARSLRERGLRLEAVAAYREVLAARPDLPLVYDELAELLLTADLHAEVPALLERARRGSVWTPRLGSVERVLVKALRGPGWSGAAHRVETPHFVVASDVDRATCELAGRELEAALRWFDARLAPLALDGRPKLRAYLFAGEAGYRAYAQEAFRASVEDTHGCYSPSLKQVLAWNLPERDRMLRTVRHEAFHQCLDLVMAEPPPWFNEGLSEVHEITGTPRAERPLAETVPEHLHLLRDADAWRPLAELVRLSPAEFYGAGAPRHYAQSWALVHWLMHGPKENEQLFRRLFDAFVERGASLKTQADVLREVDLDALDRDLRAWLTDL